MNTYIIISNLAMVEKCTAQISKWRAQISKWRAQIFKWRAQIFKWRAQIFRKHIVVLLALCFCLNTTAKVKVKTVTPQTEYAASLLQVPQQLSVTISISGKGTAEGFTLTRKGNSVTISGNDAAGCIYGANRLNELLRDDPTLQRLTTLTDAPQMAMRGACVGLQKTTYLPGHSVYEYPYTPDNFPWFYDKELWLRYLDLLAASNMNTVYLWNGHPFASLVKLDNYPFAAEVDDATMQLNQDMFEFLVNEADRRGIRVVQMFYNIILSKPFADHYGLKTQDRNRPITPLISDYTRKSITAFVRKYPKVGFLICLGEAMATIDDDIQWMKETIIPGILDGLGEKSLNSQLSTLNSKLSTLNSLPPIILRAHDTDGPRVLKESLPLYPNIYTMSKYTGESLTTYEPGGPWGETHRQLAAAAPVHIDNVHILANLEPWRWASPLFIQKAVQAMHSVHHAGGLHLYPQASYWDWPYTADKLDGNKRLLQIDRDWMWYRAWGRYAWNSDRGTQGLYSLAGRVQEQNYWQHMLADYYGTDSTSAANILSAYNEAGEIAPKLIRRFGITEGNRQTLLLGMTMAQLVNPYKFTIYPGFYESCGPKGEKLIEFVERQFKHQQHEGELPLDIAEQCTRHGAKAKSCADEAAPHVTKHKDEYARFANDMACYLCFAKAFQLKVRAAEQVLYYKWTKDIRRLDLAASMLQNSLNEWSGLVALTKDTYLYANSMQTKQRRIPIGGNDGNYKTWADMMPVYEAELEALKANIEKLKHPAAQTDVLIIPAKPAAVTVHDNTTQRTTLAKGAILFENRNDTPVDTLAPELTNLNALVLNRDTTRIAGTTVSFTCTEPVQMLVGFFQDDDTKWAKPPRLETDATGNEYGQAEPVLTNAVAIRQMPPVNIHAYHLPAGTNTIRLPKGIIMVAGFTADNIKPRDAALQGAGDEVDWLFRK